MKVEILKNDERFKIKKGQIFQAEVYKYDPSKITLLRKLTKKDGNPIGKSPVCNQYLSDVKILKNEKATH